LTEIIRDFAVGLKPKPLSQLVIHTYTLYTWTCIERIVYIHIIHKITHPYIFRAHAN